MQELNSLYQVLVPLLLTALIFWIVRFIKSVDRLASTISKMQIENSDRNGRCEEKHKAIHEKFTNIDKIMDEMKEDFSDCKTKIIQVSSKIDNA